VTGKDRESDRKGQRERERERESECETLRGVMSGSVLSMCDLNWDTGLIHITAAKNRFLRRRGRAYTAQPSPTLLGHSYYQQHVHWKPHMHACDFCLVRADPSQNIQPSIQSF